MKQIPYLSAVGSLMYVSMATRPDITYAVSHLGKYSANPGQAHWTAAQRVICYLNGTCEQRLTLGGKQPVVLRGYVDSDFAQDLDDWKSISGYSFNLGSREILWSSKKQATIAVSSTEAEYVATDHVTKEAVWLQTLLSLIGYPQNTATLIHCDNMGTISLICNPVFHLHTKHIDVKHHYVRDRVEAQDVNFEYVPTALNLADLLIKGLDRPKHWRFMEMLGVQGKSGR